MKPQALLHVGHKLMPGGLVEVIPHGLVAEDIQRRAFHAVGIASAAVDKLGGEKVVGVRMGDEQPAHGGEVQPLPQRVQPGVAGEVQQQRVVHQRLGARADVPAAQPPRRAAAVTVAESRRPALGCGCAQIGKLHGISSLFRRC